MTHDVGMKIKEPIRLRHKPQTWSYLICGKWPTFAPVSKKVGRLMDSQFSKKYDTAGCGMMIGRRMPYGRLPQFPVKPRLARFFIHSKKRKRDGKVKESKDDQVP